MIPIAQEIQPGTNKWTCVKLESFLTSKKEMMWKTAQGMGKAITNLQLTIYNLQNVEYRDILKK